MASLLLATATACSGGGDSGGGGDGGGGLPTGPTGPTTGSLTLTISGLPAGTPADLLVTGPGSYSRAVTESGTLGTLAPGRYAVAARAVRGSAGAFVARPTAQEVDVPASTTPAAATVTYEAAPSALVLAVSGVPAGSTPRLTVRRPGTADTVVAGAATLGGAAGRWQLTVDSIRVGPLTYRATPASVDTTLRGGDTLRIAVQFRAQIGSLRLVGNGLPAGVTASALVAGGGITRTAALPSRLDSLPAGEYSVVTAPVTAGAVRYVPQAINTTVRVTAGDTAAATFTFTANPSVLDVTVAGLPSGTDAAVVLTPPTGPATSITGTTRLSGVAVGSWGWRADTVSTAVARYAATPASGTATVAAGDTTRIAVAYAIASGSLAVAVTGLPAGADGAVTVTGPGGFSRALTATTTITRLVPGSYTVTAAGVTQGGTSYAPQPATQTVAVAASLTAAAASVAYTPGSPPGLSALAVSPTTVALTTGGTRQLVPTPTQPAGAPAPTYSYRSSASAVAEVSATGLITAVAPGTAVITGTATTAATAAFGAGSATAQVAVTVSAPAPNYQVDNAYVVQAVQSATRGAGLVAGRVGLLRVFVTASTTNTAAPPVRVSVFNGTTLLRTVTVSAPETAVRTAIAPGVLTSTWNLQLTAAEMVPGLRVLAELDPANTLGETNRSDNSWPASGSPHPFTVTTVPAFAVRFVPITIGTNTGNVTTANTATYLDYTQRLFPLPAVSSTVRAPYTTTSVTSLHPDSLDQWSRILSEIEAVRTAEGPAGTYYYGVLRTGYTAGYVGLAYTPGLSGIGWDGSSAAATAAHEWGHNFGRLHAPCDVEGEAGYPYPGGVIGQHGWDPATNSVVLPTVTDIMGYCDTQWVSDYTWNAVLQHRSASAAQPRVSAARAPGMLVWGRIEGGRVVLEPAFPVTAPATPPATGGTLRVELLDAQGTPLASVAVHPKGLDHSTDQHFAVVVPLDATAQAQLAGIRVRDVRLPTRGATRQAAREPLGSAAASAQALAASATVTSTGGRTRVRWTAGPDAMAMVRDSETGEILSFVRGGGAEVATGGRRVEVVFSDGVRSAVKRLF